MTNTDPKTNRQRVQDALADLLEADEHNNSYRYFRASDVADRDSELSSMIVGSHLPEIEDESSLANGITIERYTDRRCGSSLWIIRRASE